MKILNYLKQHYVLTTILVVAAMLRFYHIDFQSIWLDELITMKECNPKLSFDESYGMMSIMENNPLLYYYSVKLFSTIFGHTTFVVRMFSAVIGLLSVFGIYLLGKEIKNEKTGLIAALLLTINHFHLWYSQEARAYGLLTLLTIVSFYRLVIFLKKSTYKNAIFYGIFAALMINTHFFGLFVLVSQAIILLVFLFDAEKKHRINFLLKSAIAGAITLIAFYLFSWDIFFIAAEIKSFWIPAPTAEIYTGIFKEFFGYSESLIFINYILIIYYFISLFKEKDSSKNSLSTNKNIFSFVVIFFWVFITMLIPYLRSYLEVPMIISRYMIVVLPAAILILSISLSKINNKTIRRIVILFFIIASLTDIIVVKKHYSEIKKTQFREISNDLISKNKNKSLIVSIWGWHLDYLFNNEKNKNKINNQSLEDYLKGVRENTNKKENFWYIDGNQRPYNLDADSEVYLNSNYTLIESIEYFDTWAKYYTTKEGVENTYALNINEFEPIKSDNDINVLLFSNSTTKSKPILLEPGNYRLAIKARSIPEEPINNENAHLTLSLSGMKIGSYFLTEKAEEINYFQFDVSKKEEYKVEITFDNDLVLNNADRNALIFSVIIEKVKK